MNIFCTLQEYRRKIEEKNRKVASGQYNKEAAEEEKGEAKKPLPPNNNH